MNKITGIVPIYNVEKYLEECLDSICNQTDPFDEVILVNDGSTDGSFKICEDWAKKDARIKIINQKNEDTSNARNHGLKIATGDYVSFVDNDDWLRPEMYEKMVALAENESADLTFCSFINVDEKYNRTKINEINLTKENLKKPEYFFIKRKKNNVFFGNIACCNRILIKKSILKNIEFNTSLSINENRLFVLNLVNKTDKIAVTKEHLYNHFNPKNEVKKYGADYFKNLEAYYDEMKKHFESNNLDLEYLLNYDYVCKCIKTKLGQKNFSAFMQDLELHDKIFKNALNKTDLKKLKTIKASSSLQLSLIYNKHWSLLNLLKIKV